MKPEILLIGLGLGVAVIGVLGMTGMVSREVLLPIAGVVLAANCVVAFFVLRKSGKPRGPSESQEEGDSV